MRTFAEKAVLAKNLALRIALVMGYAKVSIVEQVIGGHLQQAPTV
jgi:hypothetical protein